MDRAGLAGVQQVSATGYGFDQAMMSMIKLDIAALEAAVPIDL